MKTTNLLYKISDLFRPKFWFFIFFYIKGLIYMVNHNYKGAIIAFQKSLNLNFRENLLPIIYEHIGKCYVDCEDNQNGKKYLIKAIELDPFQEDKNSEICSRLGFIYYDEKNYEKAKYFLKKAIKNYKNKDYTNIKLVKEYLINIDNK